MKSNQIHLFTGILLLSMGIISTSVYAQKKEPSKKDMEKFAIAMKERMAKDAIYASSKRKSFNRSSWVGDQLSELIKSWGAPTEMMSDGADGKIAIYRSSSTNSGGSYTPGYTTYNGFGQVVGGANPIDTRYTNVYVEQTTVFADKNGIIQLVKYDNDYKKY